MALLPPADRPSPDGATTPVGYLRRCTYRRIDRITTADATAHPAYEVMCLYVDPDEPLSLGDLDAARAICGGCRATGIFRPDED